MQYGNGATNVVRLWCKAQSFSAERMHACTDSTDYLTNHNSRNTKRPANKQLMRLKMLEEEGIKC